MKRIIYLLLLVVVVLAGCKSSKHLATSETKTSTKAPTSSYLASKLQLTIPGKKGSMSVGGTMKMKTHERVQISLLMPILRTEVARIEVTPDEVLLVDRMNKRFVRATKAELKNVLSKNVEFSRLEKILMDASLPGGKTELTGKDIGIILPYVWRVFVPCVHRWFLVMTIWKMGLGRIILHPDMITVRGTCFGLC